MFFLPLQLKYKEGGKKELSTNLYSVLPETEEMKLAKAAMELQSEVGRHLQGGIITHTHTHRHTHTHTHIQGISLLPT